MLLTVITISLVVSVLVYLGLFGFAVSQYQSSRQQQQSETIDPHSFSAKDQPETVYTTAELEQFEVLWQGEYGKWRSSDYSANDTAYTYVHGPYCPHDKHALGIQTVSKWVILTEHVWACDACDRTYPYPDEELGDGTIIERAMHRRIKRKRQANQSA
ncbi:hypothetical protein [Halonotius pteroides]|uniref:Uncharacterized protein n=1 Tax=Halonotius pteroides TaxID=268735 RepID=A0A3A6QAF0_9EURY|nr:hypothetical protein [Halonotius pteroides]RJX51582.1 hypothetical protein DP106_02515 [Halonotius pteroides]